MRYVLPLLALVLLAGCGSSKRAASRFDRAEMIRCLRAGGSSFAQAGGGVVRLDVGGEHRFATLAEVDVAFGRDSKDALARLRARFFFRTNQKAKPFVHGRYVGNVAYAITTLPFSKHGPKGLDAARARVRAKAKHLVEGCLARSRA
ncbi:MAG TPA: hypothetical protein VF101_11605 [Gaiellaceae bacterium]